MIRLRELREDKNLSQGQLAKEMGVNQKTISKYELGVAEPDFKMLKKLCDFFGVTAGYLLGFEEI